MALAGGIQACLGMDEEERPVDCHAVDEAFRVTVEMERAYAISPDDTCKLFVEKTADAQVQLNSHRLG